MKSEVAPLAVVVAAVLGCILCGVGAFALFAAAMAERWWPAVVFAALAAGSALTLGLVLGRRSRANGLAGVAALVAPSLLLGAYFLKDLLAYFLSEPAEPGIPVAAMAFLALATLFGVAAMVGVQLAQGKRP